MSVEIKVPTVGESINEVILAQWLKQDGDYVEMDENIAELESDKATFELPAEKAGILRIIAQEGDTLEIGALLATIEEGEAAGAGKAADATAPAAVADAAGSGAAADEKTDTDTAAASGSAVAASATATPSGESTYASGTASPAAAKILREKGIDPAAVQGTGKDGRITKEDAEKVQAGASTQAPAAPAAKTASVPATAPAGADTVAAAPGSRNERRTKMSSLRKTVSKRLVAVKNETAMLTTFNEVNMQPIMDLRAKYKDLFKEKHGVGLGFMSFFTKAVTTALKEWPGVNARIDGDEIVYHDYADISIAVSAPKGLVVPVIRNAESMSLHEIEKKIIELATKARDNKLTIEEMTGGTYTITNGGIFGSMMSTPIINAPQSAILGMHNIIQRPVAENGQVVIRPMMYIAMSYDHRIIDGRESVGFVVRVKQLLEDPARLLLEV